MPSPLMKKDVLKLHFGTIGIIVTSQAAKNCIWTSAFGFGPYTVCGCLAGHYNAIGTSPGSQKLYMDRSRRGCLAGHYNAIGTSRQIARDNTVSCARDVEYCQSRRVLPTSVPDEPTREADELPRRRRGRLVPS
ncbi:hypothetical protein DPMN_143566 [Dreissena polymorpha]|uniref:Uncharacterized protein n=1 Tax=Dreissena polymorpha TaxID=45954 RepID=A0A9D4JPF7_DREPO|nr:hypothetical protein DPMN_143566 [Dreissena polymorpha]